MERLEEKVIEIQGKKIDLNKLGNKRMRYVLGRLDYSDGFLFWKRNHTDHREHTDEDGGIDCSHINWTDHTDYSENC